MANSHRETIEKLNMETTVREERIKSEYEMRISKENAEYEEKILTLQRVLLFALF